MPLFRRSFTPAIAVLLTGVTVWILNKGLTDSLSPDKGRVVKAARRGTETDADRSFPPLAGAPGGPLTEEEYTTLKANLLAQDAACTTFEIPPEYRALMDVLVAREAFSPRMRELLDMTLDGKLTYFGRALRESMGSRLKDPSAAALRKRLVESWSGERRYRLFSDG